MKTRMWITAAAALLSAVALPAVASEYALHGRISFGSEGAMVRGVSDEDWSYIALNTLVLPEDDLWTEDGNPVEVEFPGGNFLRIGGQSKASVANIGNGIVVNGMIGSFYIQRTRRSSNAFILGTPSCTVEVTPDSMVRVDITAQGSAMVSVRWGRAKVAAGTNNPVLVSTGRQVYVEPGYLPSAPTRFDSAAEDAFDAWNRERGQFLAAGDTTYVTSTGQNPVGVRDLQTYGEFIYDGGTRYWRPTVVVDYVPYRHGHWNYVRGIGHTWVGAYPFCYVTSHYGRWSRHPRHGWVWSYRDGWAPAWAATVRSGDYFVWTPLGLDNRPVTYGSVHFSAGGVQFSMAYSSYSRASELYYGPAYVRPLQPAIVQNVTNITIWNINNTPGGGSRPGRPGSGTSWTGLPGESSLTVRDYAPQRSIRGRQAKDSGVPAAQVRVAELERRTLGDRSLRNMPAPGSTAVRTPESNMRRHMETSAPSRVMPTQTTRRSPEADTTRTMRNANPGVTAPRSVRDATSPATRGPVVNRQAQPDATPRQAPAPGTVPQIRREQTVPAQPRANTRQATPQITAPQRAVREPMVSRPPVSTNTPAVVPQIRREQTAPAQPRANTRQETPQITAPQRAVRESVVSRPAPVQTPTRQQVQQPVFQQPAPRVVQPQVRAPRQTEPSRPMQPMPTPQVRAPRVTEAPMQLRQAPQAPQQRIEPFVSQQRQQAPAVQPQVRNIQPSQPAPNIGRAHADQPRGGTRIPTPAPDNNATRSLRTR
jgi:hypothetical protein